ncbi:two component transcriptional regulator, LytTR family [Granulicatella balaenopterae]|uniref:Two component transcriptional regulator, LytTR family n=1 Tax=Granulicatella balaenopterae TaxID=137733 RepID=A0A1H9LP24_9LACT|nr:LytTR family transcriptional regulator DNA-binding domain-containing protein [Granulicatella balaenopterae]SER12977.1 two component transcriptional regulator, LytTR family [Granulicatella balaenopterae]
MLKIAIIEDNPIHLSNLEKIIHEFTKEHNCRFVVDVYMSLKACQELISNQEMYDIYFIDLEIESQRYGGLETIVEVRRYNPYASFVFMTTISEAMPLTLEAHVGVMDFIAKDSGQAEISRRIRHCLQLEMEKCFNQQEEQVDILSYSYQGHTGVSLPFRDILYVTAGTKSHRIIVFGKGYRKEIYGCLSDIKELDSNAYLYSLSRSILLNPKNVKEINCSTREIIFCEGTTCQVSYLKMNQIKKHLKRS